MVQTHGKFVVAGLAVATFGIFAQVPPVRPPFNEFVVATVKPSAPDERGGRFITMQSINRFVVKNYSVKLLLGAAYDLNPQAISGGPPWMELDKYDILAETPGSIRPNLDEQMAMLRKLLAERFQPVFHREPRTLAIYALTIAKNGSRLRSSASQSDAPKLINVVYPDHVVLPARNATMGQFASMMQRAVLDRPVVDRTGLSGIYDFDLEWTPDETQFGGQGPRDIAEPPKPGFFAAIQQQLGLKLEATRGPVQVMVVDQVQRPSAN